MAQARCRSCSLFLCTHIRAPTQVLCEFPKPNVLIPGHGSPICRPSVARSPGLTDTPPLLSTPVPTFPATRVRGPAATLGALSGVRSPLRG